MTETSNTIKYRVAVRDDETDILAVLEEVAPEIPVRRDGEERQEKIRTVIIQSQKSGKSWVAVNADDTVVGFVLARRSIRDGQVVISVQYAGVSADSRGRGIFPTLMEKLKANDVPLTATVLHNNQSGMADHLVKIGFTKMESDAKQAYFRWSPEGQDGPAF